MRKQRGEITVLGAILITLIVQALAIAHYCSPPVLIPSLKEGCMKVELTPITQEGATKETP